MSGVPSVGPELFELASSSRVKRHLAPGKPGKGKPSPKTVMVVCAVDGAPIGLISDMREL